jgi:alcohol dehydrogenase, propanol-preferring
MKAFRLVDWGRAEIGDVPTPEPRQDQVLVRVAGAGVCGSDVHFLRMSAEEAPPWRPPFTLGHETAGWIEALGESVTGWSVGDPVIVYGGGGCGRCRACLETFETCCLQYPGPATPPAPGLGLDGGMAEYLLVRHSRHLVALGDLDPRTAAPLADAGMTAYNAVRRSIGKLAPGTTAVVIGAGGVGLMATQILRALTAAQIIVLDLDAAKLEQAVAAGADATALFDVGAEGTIGEAAAAGVTAVLDCVGTQPTADLATRLVTNRGDLTLIGIGGATVPVAFGSMAWDVSVSIPFGASKLDLVDVVALARAGRAGLPTEICPLSKAQQTIERLARGEIRGRAVLNPAAPGTARP